MLVSRQLLHCKSASAASHTHNHTTTRITQGDARSLSFAPDAAIGAALAACDGGALAHLDLSGCLEMTDAGLAPVAGMGALRELVLHNCMKIGDRAIEVRARGVV